MIRQATPDLSYLAGFFDGEGCLMLVRHRTARPRPTIAVSNTDLPVLGAFQDRFNGAIYPLKDTRNHDRAPMHGYQWVARGAAAAGAVKALSPFLRVKAAQAEFWIKAFEEIDGLRGTRGNRNKEREEWLVTTLSAMKRTS